MQKETAGAFAPAVCFYKKKKVFDPDFTEKAPDPVFVLLVKGAIHDTYEVRLRKIYIGKKNFPSVTQREFLLQFFNGVAQYKKDMMTWMQEGNLQDVQDVILE